MPGKIRDELVIIDTMVFAYALLKDKGKREEALAVLDKADKIIVPDSFRAEFTNVAWQWVRSEEASEEIGFRVLQQAEGLIDRVVSSEKVWVQALQLAIAADHPAYDTLFIATAMMCKEKVVTYDKKMQSKFADWVLSPQAFLSL